MVEVSVIVNVRERFEYTDESLRSLYKTADVDFELIYVDVKSPRKHAEYLREQSVIRNFRLVRVNHYISPNMARNIGVRHSNGKYLIFVDNDVIFQPGWMSALVDCAKETGAWAVGPLYMHQDGYGGQSAVHMTVGEMTFSGAWGKREFNQVQGHFNRPLSEVPEGNLVRQASDLIEFHCALIRSDVFEKVGTLDEELLTTREHLDLCLRVLGAGGKIYFEPKAVVKYLTPPPLMKTDLPYFCLRWSDQWTRHTLQHFASKWGIAPSYGNRVMKTRARRQRLIFTPIEKSLRNIVGQRAASIITWPLKRAEPVLNNALVLALNPGRNNYATKVIHD